MIATWYHCKISGEGIPSRSKSIEIVAEQMEALTKSGLADASNEIHVGINGGNEDAYAVAKMLPDKAVLYIHGPGSRSELPTFAILRDWIKTHSGWKLLYHHSKGVTQPDDAFHNQHRRAMEKACVWDWKTCVKDLTRGFDAVGVNWVDPITRPVLPGRFFAGNFWWATVKYLLELPPIPEAVTKWSTRQRCIAEFWIGSCKRRPKVLDYERPELSAWCGL